MLCTMVASAVFVAASTLESNLRSAAALPGEPRAVSAAGAAPDDSPILTLENSSAFDPDSPRRRLVLIGADDPPAAEAVSPRCAG